MPQRTTPASQAQCSLRRQPRAMPTAAAALVVAHPPGAHGSPPAARCLCTPAHSRAAALRCSRRLRRRCTPAARLACSLDGGEQPSGQWGDGSASFPSRSLWASSPPFLQRLASANTPVDVFQACAEAALPPGAAARAAPLELQPQDCETVLEALVQLRRVPLAMATYQVLRSRVSTDAAHLAVWAPLGASGAAALARALCRALAVGDALAVVGSLCWGNSAASLGAAAASAASSAVPSLSFGYVVRCPHCASDAGGAPGVAALALVQPQDGCKRAACAACGYDFEVFSGEVVSASSQAVTSGESALARAARLVGITPPAAAIHELSVASPGGQQRAFRVGTAGPEVPARLGHRISVACAAPWGQSGGSSQPRGRDRLVSRVLPPIPPRSRPSQALEVSNHDTGGVTPVCAPPPAAGVSTGPSIGGIWPTLLALAAVGDGASGLVDPALPGLLLAGAAVASAAVAAVDSLVLPQLARLPPTTLVLESIRQGLLAQHAALSSQASEQAVGAGEDVRTLGRLWQLALKMQAMGDQEMYGARLGRVTAAREAVEARLAARLALLERYGRVASMIEIEVELDSGVAPAELTGAAAGIAAELAALEEAQQVADVWRNAATAADEVERLLASVAPG